MKKKSLFSIFVCLSVFVGCFGAVPTTGNKEETHSFQFTVYASDQAPDVEITEEHFLGAEITPKWNLFNKRYTQVYEMSVGFSGSTVEIIKPVVYNAVLKINGHLRKQLKKELIQKEEAVRILSRILDCAIAVQSEYDTETFEKTIAKIKNPAELIGFFDNVDLQYL